LAAPPTGCLGGLPVTEVPETPWEKGRREAREAIDYLREGASIALDERRLAARERQMEREWTRHFLEVDRLAREQRAVDGLRLLDSAQHHRDFAHDARAKRYFDKVEKLSVATALLNLEAVELETQKAHLTVRKARHRASGP
jgi:hypothetical protein